MKLWILDTAEKTGATLVQAAIVYMVAAQTMDSDFWRGLVVALVIAAVNVLKAAMTAWIPQPKSWRLDMVVRALWTFVISVLGSLASIEWFDLISASFWKSVLLAGLMAALAVVKAAFAYLRPEEGMTPASLVPASTADKVAA